MVVYWNDGSLEELIQAAATFMEEILKRELISAPAYKVGGFRVCRILWLLFSPERQQEAAISLGACSVFQRRPVRERWALTGVEPGYRLTSLRKRL